MSTTTAENPLKAAEDFSSLLRLLGACEEARSAAKGVTLRQAWDRCERGDWLLWLAAKLEIYRKLVVLAACDCARTALRHVKPGEDRPRIAIETAEAWTRGEVTLGQVRKAAHAAYAAYGFDLDADAAYSAASAAASAYADAADAYAADAASTALYGTRSKACANLVRACIPFALIADAAKARTS